ncbi:hypothetical protein NDU88_006413 [Pleurodeles waltl]|uniref:Uncharacterized protein n=1 Tax=Pleurodeles waltl TaxID=8319 RepID=A0AAV7X177_PLEWA|nr:hypothetical protein NDU88_006413 [Pleurodeles waltl]
MDFAWGDESGEETDTEEVKRRKRALAFSRTPQERQQATFLSAYATVESISASADQGGKLKTQSRNIHNAYGTPVRIMSNILVFQQKDSSTRLCRTANGLYPSISVKKDETRPHVCFTAFGYLRSGLKQLLSVTPTHAQCDNELGLTATCWASRRATGKWLSWGQYHAQSLHPCATHRIQQERQMKKAAGKRKKIK